MSALSSRLLSAIAVVCALLATSTSHAQSSLFTPATRPVGIEASAEATFMNVDAEYFRNWEPDDRRSAFIPNVQLPGGKYVALSLNSFPLLTRDARIVTVTEAGEKPHTPRKHVFMRGTIAGEPNSHVFLAIWETYAVGYIEREFAGTQERYLIQPTGGDIFKQQTLIIYRHTGKMPDLACALGDKDLPRDGGTPIERDPNRRSTMQMKGGGVKTQSTTPMAVTQALELSNDFYVNRGGSNTDQAFEYAWLVTAAESDVYQKEVNTSVMISNARVWTATDPFTGANSETQLNQFRTHYVANMQATARNAAHLYCSQNFGGVAWLDVLCDPYNNNGYGYAFSGLLGGYVYPNDGFFWDRHVTSHELGHNIGSPHTQSCWYNPPIDSCVAAEDGNCYATWQTRQITGTIMSYCNSRETTFHPRTRTVLRNYIEASCASSVNTPIANAGPDVTACGTGGVQIGANASGGNAPLEYWWRPSTGLSSTSVASPIASPTSSRTYIVRVTDDLGLRTYDTVNVTVYPGVSLNASADKMVCKGSGVKIGNTGSSTAAPVLYSWSPSTGLDDPNAAQPTATPNTTTTYVQTVTDQNGCIKRDTITVTVNTAPSISLSDPPGICGGADIEIGAEATGGTGPYAYTWTPSTGLSSTTIARPTASPLSTTKYYVTVTDAVGCQRRDSVTVTIGSSLKANAGNDVAACKGTTVSLGENITGGVGPFKITWWPKAGLSDSTIMKPVLTATADATYYVEVTDSKGCSSRDTVIVMVSEGPKLTGLQHDAIMCKGSPVAIGVAATGGQGPYTYQWQPSIGLSSTSVATPEARPTKNTTYSVKVRDVFGCEFTDTVRVTVGEGVKFTLGADQDVCMGSSIILAPQSPIAETAKFAWKNLVTMTNASAERSLTVTPTANGRYELTITDGDCVGRDTIEVKVVPAAVASVSGELEFCQFDSTVLTAPAGFAKYRWSNGSTAQSLIVKTEGNYWCAVENSDGCADTAEVTVVQNPAPQAAITVSGDTLVAATAKSYQWYMNGGAINGATGRSYLVTTSGTYHVVVSNEAGCTAKSAEVNKIISGIRDLAQERPRVVPNPTTGLVTIRIPGSMDIKRVYLTTLLGSEINISLPLELNNNIELDLRSLASGTYLLHIVTGTGEHIEKIVKQ